MTMDHPLGEKPSIAVVQYAVDAINPDHHTVIMGGTDVQVSVNAQFDKFQRMLGESSLFGSVVPYAQFAATPGYVAAGIRPDRPIFRPDLPSPMPLFSIDRELAIAPDAVRTVAAATGTDVILFVSIEYFLDAGWKKTAVADGRFALYGKDGRRIAHLVAGGAQKTGVFPAGVKAVKAWEIAAIQACQGMLAALRSPHTTAREAPAPQDDSSTGP